MLLDLAKAWMIPFPPFGWVFVVGVVGFVLGLVVNGGVLPHRLI
jgi:hypothetical protein